MHKKEELAAPLFRESFNAHIITPSNINTDQFGTFTLEVRRPENLEQVLRDKVKLGMEMTGAKYGIASEGSFGPDPLVPFLQCNQESLIWLDNEREIEIILHHKSHQSAFYSLVVESEVEIISLIDKVRTVIIRVVEFPDQVFKGINNKEEAIQVYLSLREKFPRATIRIETDNRSYVNPTRQTVISEAIVKLVEILKSLCPKCGCPGFQVCDNQPGLECSFCGTASDYAKQEVWACSSINCSHQEIKPRRDGKNKLDPQYCTVCNP